MKIPGLNSILTVDSLALEIIKSLISNDDSGNRQAVEIYLPVMILTRNQQLVEEPGRSRVSLQE